MDATWFLNFLRSQFLVTLPKPEKDFSGQTIIVTGSNTGLGKEAVRHLSRLNAARIIIAVRTTYKGETAKNEILKETGRKPDTIEVWPLDLQSFDSVKAFVARAKSLDRLDGIIENAGIMTGNFKIVAGYESTITTNVISTFLLALLIVPKLKETAAKYNVQTHISVVSSDLHFIAAFPEQNSENIFDALNVESTAKLGGERYAVSKLLEVFAVRELASVLDEHGSKSPTVLVNCMTPGACISDFDRESTGLWRMLREFAAMLMARTTEAGSRTLIASLSAGDESQGQYMENCVVTAPSAFVLSPEGQKVQKKVWAELSEILEAVQPGVMQSV